MYKYKIKGLTISPGIRHESIKLNRDDYGNSNPNREDDNLSSRQNKVSVLIPGLGLNYKFNNSFSLFGGVHKGYSPPGSSVGQKAEESINTELGVRFAINQLSGEIIAYRNDYNNLLGNDLAATGGFGELDPFNAGKALVSGFEILLNSTILKKFPISLSYTHTDAKFLTSFGSTQDIWGEVNDGDRIPYIPQHKLNTSLGFKTNKLEFNLNANYNGKFSTLANGSEQISSYLVCDLSINYIIKSNLTLKSKILNIFDEKYAVSRAPAGLRPGHPFGIYTGVEFKF
tara:strand:- start:162 stop:1019 length:858 start_codon:yes stop_codon:yes gene_type:complete